jgi:hypothetical protein
VPFDVLTVTLTVPLPGGLVAVILLVEPTCTALAPAVPKRTRAPEAKQRPVMVTLVPPAAGPTFGWTELTPGRPTIPQDGVGGDGTAGWIWMWIKHPAKTTVAATVPTTDARRRHSKVAARPVPEKVWLCMTADPLSRGPLACLILGPVEP